jgi:MHS family proline/betaine transporter-like MFS transporter
MMPISGYLADKLNRKVLLSVLTIILLIFLFPAFALMTADHSTRIILFFLGLTVLFGLIQGALPVTFVELFPPVTRASGLSISFNISNALFGGTAPLIATYLISLTHSYYALIAYLTFAMLVFILTALLMKKRK